MTAGHRPGTSNRADNPSRVTSNLGHPQEAPKTPTADQDTPPRSSGLFDLTASSGAATASNVSDPDSGARR